MKGLAAVALSAIVAAPSGAAASGGWSSYGPDLANSRSQPRPAGIGAATAPRLVERWARRHTEPVDGATYSVTGSPAVVGGTAYYADWTGRLMAVELQTGGLRWSTKVSTSASISAAVNSSPAVAGGTVYVSALEGRVVAVSARTGAIRWSTVLDTHGLTTLYSSPVVSGRRLVVGVASAQNSSRRVRTTSAAASRRSTPGPARSCGRPTPCLPISPAAEGRSGGRPRSTRSAASPTSVPVRDLAPGRSLTDALLALRLRDGSLAWHRQFTRNDVWNAFGESAARTTTSAPRRTCSGSAAATSSASGTRAAATRRSIAPTARRSGGAGSARAATSAG